jgi:hypothetical protein
LSPGGTYYVDKVTLTVENADNIRRLVTTGKGMDVVKAAVEVSVEGRAAKQDYALFALAMAEVSQAPKVSTGSKQYMGQPLS